ncbi:uncharacterized protein LOC134540944 [Bacillus rossius redtenbacheri]|uniref:uncharacterized protein LOC134540944 n=1 Tax=Bacillus rossius redtenbacheri TaxID=93214 RepID=UPI002FDD5B16
MVKVPSDRGPRPEAPEAGTSHKALHALKQNLKSIVSSGPQDEGKVRHVFACLEQILYSCDAAEWGRAGGECVTVLQYCLNVLVLLHQGGNKLLFETMSAKWINILWAGCRRVPQMTALVVRALSEPMLCFALKSSLPLGPRKVVLETLRSCVGRAPPDVRRGVFSRHQKLVAKLLDLMTACGDFNMQSACLQTALHFAGSREADRAAVSQPLLRIPQARQVFLLLDFHCFAKDSRFFLNMLNTTMGLDAMVFSVPCSSVFIGQEQIYQPKDLSEFWVDFNYGSVSISMLYDQRQQQLPSSQTKSLTVLRHDVKSVVLYDSVSSRALTITLNRQCSGFQSGKIKIVMESNQFASDVDGILVNMFRGIYTVQAGTQRSLQEKKNKSNILTEAQVPKDSEFESSLAEKPSPRKAVRLSTNGSEAKASVTRQGLEVNFRPRASGRTQSFRKHFPRSNVPGCGATSRASPYFPADSSGQRGVGTPPNIFTPPQREVAASIDPHHCKASTPLFTKRKTNLFEYLSQKKTSLSGDSPASSCLSRSVNDASTNDDRDTSYGSFINNLQTKPGSNVKLSRSFFDDKTAVLKNSSDANKVFPLAAVENSSSSTFQGNECVLKITPSGKLSSSEAKNKIGEDSSEVSFSNNDDLIDSSQNFDTDFEMKMLFATNKTGTKVSRTSAAPAKVQSQFCVSGRVVSEHFVASSVPPKLQRVERHPRETRTPPSALREQPPVDVPVTLSRPGSPASIERDAASAVKSLASVRNKTVATKHTSQFCTNTFPEFVADGNRPLEDNHSKLRESGFPETEIHNEQVGKMVGTNCTSTDPVMTDTEKVISNKGFKENCQKSCMLSTINDDKNRRTNGESISSSPKLADLLDVSEQEIKVKDIETLGRGSPQSVKHEAYNTTVMVAESSAVTLNENQSIIGNCISHADEETDCGANPKPPDAKSAFSEEKMNKSENCTVSTHSPAQMNGNHEHKQIVNKTNTWSKSGDISSDLANESILLPQSRFLNPQISAVGKRKSRRLSLSITGKNDKCVALAHKTRMAEDMIMNDSGSVRDGKLSDTSVWDTKRTETSTKGQDESGVVTGVELRKHAEHVEHNDTASQTVPQCNDIDAPEGNRADSASVKRASVRSDPKCPQTKEKQNKGRRKGRKPAISVEKTIHDVNVMISRKVENKLHRDAYDTPYLNPKRALTFNDSARSNKKRKLFYDETSAEIFEVNRARENSSSETAKCPPTHVMQNKQLDSPKNKENCVVFDSLLSGSVQQARGTRKNRSNLWAEKLKQLPSTDTDESFRAERKMAVSKRVRSRTKGKQAVKKAVVRSYEDDSSGDGLPPLVIEVVPLRYKSFANKGNKPASRSFSPLAGKTDTGVKTSSDAVYDEIFLKNKKMKKTVHEEAANKREVLATCDDSCGNIQSASNIQHSKISGQNATLQNFSTSSKNKCFVVPKPDRKNLTSSKEDSDTNYNCPKSTSSHQDYLKLGGRNGTNGDKHQVQKVKKMDLLVQENTHVNLATSSCNTVKTISFEASAQQTAKTEGKTNNYSNSGLLSAKSLFEAAASVEAVTNASDEKHGTKYNLRSCHEINDPASFLDSGNVTNDHQHGTQKQRKKLRKIDDDAIATNSVKQKSLHKNKKLSLLTVEKPTHPPKTIVSRKKNDQKDRDVQDGECTNVSERVPAVGNVSSEREEVKSEKVSCLSKGGEVTFADCMESFFPPEAEGSAGPATTERSGGRGRRTKVEREVTVTERCSQFSQSVDDGRSRNVVVTKKTRQVTYGKRRVSWVESSGDEDCDGRETRQRRREAGSGTPSRRGRPPRSVSPSRGSDVSASPAPGRDLCRQTDSPAPNIDKTTPTTPDSETINRNTQRGIHSYEDSLEISSYFTQVRQTATGSALDELASQVARQMALGDWRLCLAESHAARQRAASQFVAGVEEDIGVLETYQAHLRGEVACLDRLERSVRSMMARGTQAAAEVASRLGRVEQARARLEEGAVAAVAAESERAARSCSCLRRQLQALGAESLRRGAAALAGSVHGIFASLFRQ